MKLSTCFFALLIWGWLGIYQGHLALWQKNSALPSHIFEQTPDIYPEADRSALRKGIPFGTEEEMHRLLEDFLS